MKKISFAILGGGPAGFYTAKLLAKLPCAPQIHIYQRQLCPFGLIRYGVAPDHVSIKKSQLTLSSIQNYQNFQYIGNQNIDNQKLQQLKSSYSGVIFAYGADGDTSPKIKIDKQRSENDSTVSQSLKREMKLARQIVYWYNNHPKYENTNLNLRDIRNVTIIGNGNVSIDISRIFLRNPQELSKTQISPTALNNLRQSSITNISIVGRRGVTQSAFALKQVRQLSKHKIKLYAIKEQLEASSNQASYLECTAIGDNLTNIVRMNKRKTDFIKQHFEIISLEQLNKVLQNDQKKVIFRYLLNPQQLTKCKQLTFKRTELKGQPFKQKAQETSEIVKIDHDMLIYSTGFKVNDIEGKPYQENKIPNSSGCLMKNQSELQKGLYAVGWCKTGPQGVIDQTLLCCQETFNNIRIHQMNGILEQKSEIKRFNIFNEMKNISFQQYKKVRQFELENGDKSKFIKRKLNTSELLQAYSINNQ